MPAVGSAEVKRTVVQYYGRGSLLGVWSLFIAYFMASQGMNGWQQRALEEMERDATEMGGRAIGSRPPTNTQCRSSASPSTRSHTSSTIGPVRPDSCTGNAVDGSSALLATVGSRRGRRRALLLEELLDAPPEPNP